MVRTSPTAPPFSLVTTFNFYFSVDGRERALQPAKMTDIYFMDRSENTVIFSNA
jgi:hypothetical protein